MSNTAMTLVPAGTPYGVDETFVQKKQSKKVPLLLQLAAMVGIGALVYSSAADWVSRLGHNSEVSGYVTEVEGLPETARLDHLRVAQEYNSHIPSGVLRDPYSTTQQDLSEDTAYQAYEEVLRVSDNGVIGEVSYPRVGISLPI